LAKSDYLPLCVALAYRNGLQYRNSDFKMFICDDLATVCVNLVNFDLVTAKFRGLSACTPRLKNKSHETNDLRIYLTEFHQIFTMWLTFDRKLSI